MASNPSNLDKLILRMTAEVHREAGKPLLRTQLVKLVYLADYFYAQQTGKTLTGARYRWDRHGPNAQGNQIVIRADMLSAEGKLHIERTRTPGGSPRYLYSPVRGATIPRFQDKLAEAVIALIVERYGRLDWNAITSAAKSTRPFRTAQPRELLNLSPDASRVAALRRIEAELAQEPIRHGKPVSLRELRARHGAAG